MIVFFPISEIFEILEEFFSSIFEILSRFISIFTDIFNTYPFWFFVIIGMLISLLIIDIIKLVRESIKKSKDKKEKLSVKKIKKESRFDINKK